MLNLTSDQNEHSQGWRTPFRFGVYSRISILTQFANKNKEKENEKEQLIEDFYGSDGT